MQSTLICCTSSGCINNIYHIFIWKFRKSRKVNIFAVKPNCGRPQIKTVQNLTLCTIKSVYNLYFVCIHLNTKIFICSNIESRIIIFLVIICMYTHIFILLDYVELSVKFCFVVLDKSHDLQNFFNAFLFI